MNFLRAIISVRTLCVLAYAACLPGCVLLDTFNLRSPAARAQDMAPRCAKSSVDKTPALFSPSAIEKVDPAITHVQSGPMPREARLRGALLHIAPSPGLTHEALQRALACHEAHVLLGTERALPNDPYTLPGVWLDIDADSDGDGFAVQVCANDFPHAKEVLDRAQRFAAADH